MKKQLKKSFSLFLAVLMVLSCWVWVAPTEASAATEGYPVSVKWKVTDTTDAGKNPQVEIKVWYRENNGTSTTVQVMQFNCKDTSYFTSDGDKEYSLGEIPGFPIAVQMQFTVDSSGTDSNEGSINWYALKVGQFEDILSGNLNYTFTRGGAFTGGWGDKKAFYLSDVANPTEASGDALAAMSYEWPKIAGFDSGSGTDIKFNLNPIGGGEKRGGTTYSYSGYYDQYGVKWTASSTTFADLTEETYLATTKDSLTPVTYDDLYYDSTTQEVVAKPELQVNQPKSNGIFETYLVKKYTATNSGGAVYTSVASAKVSITYPTLTYSFNGNGSVSNLGAKIYGVNGTLLGTGSFSKSGYHGSSLGEVPSNDNVVAPGYTFKGFWTTKQPTSGNAYYYAKEADFAEPISSEKFAQYQADGGTVSGSYITYEGKQYYNAGTMWNTGEKTIDSNKVSDKLHEYYGWWISDDITVKFYDIDGSFLGEQVVKSGQTQKDIEWPTPEESYTSGAFQYNTFSGIWENTDGVEVSQDKYTFTHDLILTPTYNTVNFTDKYTVNFIDQNGNGNLPESNQYAYRTDLGNSKPADRDVPTAIKNDVQYSYTFEGWSSATPINGEDYHVMLEDGDFDTAGNAIAINTDWIVRNSATYYPVYRRHVRTYAVEFWYKDSTGADASRKVSVKYGDVLTAPIDYVPYTYAQAGYGYTFNRWEYSDKDSNTANFAYSASIPFDQDHIKIQLGAVDDGDNVTPINITAAYGTPVPTPYNVTFKYRNDKGELVTETFEVKHGDLITEETVNALKPHDKWDNGEALVTYNGSWAVTEGAAGKAEYTIEELASFSPTSHVTFEAVYGNPQAFYTVTYIDGTNTYSERVLVGSNLPVWTTKQADDNGTPDNTEDDKVTDIEYIPEKAETAQGTYEFQGWYDEKQADTTYAKTNGNKYTAESKVSSDLTLYPQFKFEPNTYTIKFMDHEGKTQLAAGEYQYGQSIEQLVTEANKAAQGRAQDNTYTYTFLGWDKEVPTYCEGADMVFTAQYKPVYRYYKANWYNSLEDMNAKKTDDDGKVIGLLATTNHTYNSKVYNPSVSLTPPTSADATQNYVFAGWCYKDSEGNEQPYVRGMLITGEMEFYATYTLTKKTYTVTTVVKSAETKYNVADGDTAKEIPTPISGYVDETYHDEFAGWYTTATYDEGTEFAVDTKAITENITIYAKFTQSEHDRENKELISDPTYYAMGKEAAWCSCDPKKTRVETDIAKLADNVAPTGTIYLGTQGSWSSTGVAASATDSDPVSIYANANTTLILTINDTGNVNTLYNPSGVGKGIALIQAFISKGVYSPENPDVEMSEIKTIYEDDSESLNNAANYVIRLGEYGELEDGATYVAYYYVKDKAGNILNRNVRTAKFIYDTTAPSFDVEGNNNAALLPDVSTPTYCETATITGIEKGATVTVNGQVVNATYKDGEETGTYKVEEAGNYLVTVTDKAGNKTSKKFAVNEEHTYEVKEAPSTCTTDGYKSEKCAVCGHVKTETIYPATGHITRSTPIDATCTEDGYILNECENCDYSIAIYHEVEWVAEADGDYEYVIDEDNNKVTQTTGTGEEAATEYLVYVIEDGEKVLIAEKLGHSYPTKIIPAEEEGAEPTKEIIYTVATDPTCKISGKETSTCEYCDNTISREIVASDYVKVEDGATIKVNGAEIAETDITDGKYELGEEGEYVVVISKDGTDKEVKYVVGDYHNWGATKTLKATCTEDGKKYQSCKLCHVSKDVEVIPATGHVETQWVVTTAATCGAEGVETEQCKKCKAYIIKDYEVEYETETDAETGETVYKLDENGDKIVKTTTDDEGNTVPVYVVDEDGNKIPVYNTRSIPATGRHIIAVSTDPDKTWEATTDKEGQITRYCTQCGAEWVEKVAKIEKYTVKFEYTEYGKDTDGKETTVDKTVTVVKIAGETITEEDVNVTPTKPDSADGKYSYTFQAWVDAEDKDYALPLDVTADLPYVVEKVIESTAEDGTVTYATEWVTEAEGAYEYVLDEDGNKVTKTEGEGDEAVTSYEVYKTQKVLTLEPSFKQSNLIYTHKFVVPTTYSEVETLAEGDEEAAVEMEFGSYEEFAVMMGAKGDERKPTAKPSFTAADADDDAALKKLYTFTFKGWANAKGEIVTNFAIATDATFYAVFEVKAIAYEVIYYSGTSYVWKTTVDGGKAAVYANKDAEGNLVYPTKDYDDTYHYAFDKWYVDEGLKTAYNGEAITATTRLYAGYTSIAHAHDKAEGKGEVVQSQSCTLPELTKYLCACGDDIIEQTKEKLGHKPGAAETVKEEDGTVYSVVKCTVCGVELSRTKTSVTVIFKYDTGVRLATYNYNVDDAIEYKGEAPTKAADKEYTYTFAGWYLEGDETQTVVDLENAKAASDAVYVAKFTSVIRTFRVSYVDNNNKVLYTVADIAYGADVPEYAGATKVENITPKAYTNDVHYVFGGWDIAENATVTSDIVIKPLWTAVKHDVKLTSDSSAATCTQAGGMKYACTAGCGYAYTDGTVPATGHKYESVRVEPDYDNGIDGYIKYTCANCGDNYTETLSAELITVTVNVKDSNGNPRQGVTVALVYADEPNKAVEGTYNQVTGADGIATFKVKPGRYMAKLGDDFYEITVDNDRNVSGGDVTESAPEVNTPSCSCSCHRDGFWGTIFRFFHKIIKFFTGRINCCSCPDSRY